MNDMDMNYTFPIIKTQRVLDHRPTEPAMRNLFKAIRMREEREKSFNVHLLTAENKEEYLDSIAEELKARSQTFKYNIFEIGKLLYEVKKNLPHGEFQPWVEKNFELGYRTAHHCMSVFLVCMGHPEVIQYFNASCLYLIAKPSFPGGLREALFDGAKGPVDVSKKELIQVALKYKNGEVSTNDEEVQNLLKKQRDITVWEKYKIELMALVELVDNRLERMERLFKFYPPTNPLIECDQEDFTKEDMESDIKSKIKNFKVEINMLLRQLEEKCK